VQCCLKRAFSGNSGSPANSRRAGLPARRYCFGENVPALGFSASAEKPRAGTGGARSAAGRTPRGEAAGAPAPLAQAQSAAGAAGRNGPPSA